MRLSPYLRSNLILTHLEASDMEEVFTRLGRTLVERGAIPPGEPVGASLLAREIAHSTVLGDGIALPHATVPGLEEPLLAVALASEPVDFGAADLGPVKVFFVLLSPPGRESDHIKIMARICRLARHPGFIAELGSAADEREALDAILRVDGEHV